MSRGFPPRLGFLLLLALLAVLALAACSSSSGSNAAPEPDPPGDVENPGRDDDASNADDEPAPDEGDEPDPPDADDDEPGDPDPTPDDGEDDADGPVEDEEPDLLALPRAYDNEFALSVLEDLSVGIGPRARGTAGETAAADYLAETFADLGYVVERQAFSLRFDAVSRVDLSVEGDSVVATPFSGTIGGEVAGPVVAVPGLGSASDFDGIDVDGAIVLIERGVLFFQEKIANAAAAGAVGALIYNNEAGGFDGSLEAGSTIPAASLSRSAGVSLRREAELGPINGTMRVDGGRSQVISENIIASSGGACRLYVGGHYDSVVDVVGANDNGSGTALVVELARAFAGVEGADRICFVGFAAEEAVGGIGGIAGSAFLVDQLVASGAIDQAVAMLNLDVAAAGSNSVVLVGSTELAFAATEIANALGIAARLGSLPANTGSDYLNFQQAGVPVLFLTIFGARIHVPEDNFDAVDPAILDSVGRLAHAMLQCLVAATGGNLPSPAGCGLSPS